jgi:large subunit ribosomal protein L30
VASIIVKQVKSTCSQPPEQERVLRALGLRRIGRVRKHKDNNCIRGMINKVRHLVSYELVKD